MSCKSKAAYRECVLPGYALIIGDLPRENQKASPKQNEVDANCFRIYPNKTQNETEGCTLENSLLVLSDVCR